MLGVQELLIILVIAVVIFGGKRIPEIMEGMGKGIRSFKKAVDGEEDSKSSAHQEPASSKRPGSA